MKIQNGFAVVSLAFLALVLCTYRANATVILQFNNKPNDVIGGSPEIIRAAPGGNALISLQLVSTTETTIALDYWLTQFSGPQSGVFSITGRDYTGSDFNRPEWGNGVTTTTRDDFNNSQSMGLNHPDGIPDNLLSPRNGPDLGGRFTSEFNPPGIHQVATFTLTISLNAAPGLYEIQTFDYPGFGYGNDNFETHDFDGQQP